MLFKDKILKLRNKLALTQAELGKILKVTQSTIAVWEKGVTECATNKLALLEKLCLKKGVKINWRK